jgi:phage terminase small subunit
MPLNLQQEAFVTELVAGKNAKDAYIAAGYRPKTNQSAIVSANRLAKQPGIVEAIERLKGERDRIKAEAIKLAIERTAITLERVAVELGRIGFANMMDYMKIDPATGDPRLDWSDLSREQAAALLEVTVDDYVDGRGENARDVRKVRFKLGDKRASLMDIAKLFGWIVDKRETKIVDEFDSMTDKQIEAWLDERAEARVKTRQLRESPDVRRRMRRGRMPAGSVGTLGPTTAQGKPH